MSQKSSFMVGVVVIILFLGTFFWYFTYTERGSSIVQYSIGTLGSTPANIHTACTEETAPRVKAKFSQPLSVDPSIQSELENFWNESYLKECLYRNGYGTDGIAIPKSLLTSANDVSVYKNVYRGFGFTFPQASTLTEDNILNVDLDASLLTSRITVGTKQISISIFSGWQNIQDTVTLAKTYAEHPQSTAQIVDTAILKSNYGVDVIRLLEADGTTRILFRNQNDDLVMITSSYIPPIIMDSILQTISVL